MLLKNVNVNLQLSIRDGSYVYAYRGFYNRLPDVGPALHIKTGCLEFKSYRQATLSTSLYEYTYYMIMGITHRNPCKHQGGGPALILKGIYHICQI